MTIERLKPGIIAETNARMPMRDGITLSANIFRPEATGRYPAVLVLTPYGKAGFNATAELFVNAGYAFITVDFRGRYESDGEWTVFSEENTLDFRDGYDSVEWIAAREWCNGSIGTSGDSYCSWIQWGLAALRPPHLKAMSARTITTELTDIDWPGAFRPARRVHWWTVTMAPDLRRRQNLSGPHTPAAAAEAWQTEHQQLLYFLPWKQYPELLPEPLAESARKWFADPGRKIWRFSEAHHEIEVPNLDMSGWYDHIVRTVDHLSGLQKNGRSELARRQSRIILGPWNHVTLCSRKTGEMDFGEKAQLSKDGLVLRWFNHWLKGEDNGVDRDSAVRYFVMGLDDWREAETWPPPGAENMTFHLSAAAGASGAGIANAGILSPAVPEYNTAADEYSYDPRNPVPTLWDDKHFTQPPDRRKLEYRSDILYYRSAPLDADLEIAGEPSVIIYVSSSAKDTDFFARLVDERLDGPALEIAYGMVRVRHRNGFDRKDLLSPDEIVELKISLNPTACRFQKGNRIRLEITSSDFPNFDRNHNTGGDDLAETELITARQKLYHGREHTSRLQLPVMP